MKFKFFLLFALIGALALTAGCRAADETGGSSAAGTTPAAVTEEAGSDTPATAASDNETPGSDAPATEPAHIETSDLPSPVSELPETEAPATEPAGTDAPATASAGLLSVVPTGRVLAPMAPLFDLTQPLPNGQYSAALTPGCLREAEGQLTLTAELYAYERFDPAQVHSLQSGDALLYLGREVLIAGYTELEDGRGGLPFVELNDEVHEKAVYPDYPFLSFAPDVVRNPDGTTGFAFTAVDGQAPAYCGCFTDIYLDLQPVGQLTLPCSADLVFEDRMDYDPVVYTAAELTEQLEAETQPQVAFSQNRILLRVEDGIVTRIIRDFRP